MMFLFTSSPKIGSRAIRWALDEPCSHFAMVFDERENGYGIVFHSHLSGVSFDWFRNFYTTNRIVVALRPKNITLSDEERLYQSIVSRFYGKKYDKKQFLEFAYYALRRKATGSEIPSTSRFGKKDAFLCTEISAGIKEAKPEYFGSPFSGDLITPYQLYFSMLKSNHIEPVPWIADVRDMLAKGD